MSCSQYLDNSGGELGKTFVHFNVETCNCDRQAESSRTRAAWIDELHAVTLGHHGLVRVTGYDNVEASSSRVDVDFLQVMEYVNADSLQLQSEVKRNVRRPRALVVVSPDRVDRRYGAQLLQNLGAADVARMDDVLNARECTDRFRAKQSVRIGDEAYRFQWIARGAVSLLCKNQCPTWQVCRGCGPLCKRVFSAVQPRVVGGRFQLAATWPVSIGPAVM
jgi:hypothetical protein